MGFFDNLKSSLAETGQDLSQKAKDTTEIFRLTNLNKTKEKEIEKECLWRSHSWRSPDGGCQYCIQLFRCISGIL